MRQTELDRFDHKVWVVDVIRNAVGIVERQLVFTTFTASFDVFRALVEKYAVAARAA